MLYHHVVFPADCSFASAAEGLMKVTDCQVLAHVRLCCGCHVMLMTQKSCGKGWLTVYLYQLDLGKYRHHKFTQPVCVQYIRIVVNAQMQ